MKNLIFGAAALMVVAMPVQAGHCPVDVKAIDVALKQTSLSATQQSEIKAPRDKDAELHKAGKHSESLKVLHDALMKLGVEH